MGPESEVFLTLFKPTIYVFPFVAQGLNEIVMMTMVIMMITDFATFCYSPVRMQEESLLSASERSNPSTGQRKFLTVCPPAALEIRTRQATEE
jgi:hypothetical protein